MVEDYTTAVGVIEARQIARYALKGHAMPSYLSHLAGVQVDILPMPRGGVRYLLVCPICHQRATRLYGRYHAGYRRMAHACRKCWGLRYQSQYAGRRIEAHPEYLQRVTRRQIERTPREPRGYLPVPARRQMARHRHAIRMYRYERADALCHVRTVRHMERRGIAGDLAFIVLLARSISAHNRRWRKILNQVLWPGHHHHAPTLRNLIAHKDTPEWARKVLREALQRAEEGEKEPIDTRKTIKTASETDTKEQLGAIIESDKLEAIRARYAALGQGRRGRRAA